MAEDVSRHSSAEAPAVPVPPSLVEPVAGRRERARRSSYRTRFLVVYAALAALVLGGIGAFAVLLVRDAPADAAPWSSWKPEGNALEKLQQIVDRVAGSYVTADNSKLNIAIARPLVAQVDDNAIPVGAIVIESGVGAVPGRDNVAVYNGAESVGIALCGLGPACSVPGGNTAEARFALQREALELSLYAMKYIDDLDSVVVYLPPSAAGQSSGLVFIRRDDVKDELKLPLAETLDVQTSHTVGDLSAEDNASVARLTDSRVYSFAYEAAPDGNPIIVLTPPGG